MHRPISRPETAGKRIAFILLLFFAGEGMLVRLSRRDFDLLPQLKPLDFHGTSPNFFACAGAPFIAFAFKKWVSFPDYVKTAVGTAFGLSLYELAQIWLPRRTFDPWDIAASFLGALLSI